MKLFGFRINAGEIKDVREIEKTLENIEEKKNKIIDLAGQLSTLWKESWIKKQLYCIQTKKKAR